MHGVNLPYFAYGSNMHLGQMAVRCPGSRMLGLVAKPGWRFMINQRGYQNWGVSSGHQVSVVYSSMPQEAHSIWFDEIYFGPYYGKVGSHDYSLQSAGPDLNWGGAYDPTNGATSGGQIWYFSNGIQIPGRGR